MYPRLPDIDDSDFDEQLQKISQSDSKIQQQLALLIHEMTPPEKMALGLNAYFLLNESHYQLCDLRPKHGEYATGVQTGIELVRQLSPQGKAEFAADLLMDDWEMGPADDNLVAPSTIIE